MANVEEVAPVEVGLNASNMVVDFVASNVLAAIASTHEVLTENGVHLEKIKGPDVSEILKFDDGDSSSSSSSDGTTYEETEKLHRRTEKEVETGESSKIAGEVFEEEIVELEFEKVKPKLDTHTMHCPKCKEEVTKVILRRKLYTIRPTIKKSAETLEEKPSEPKDLIGCFSCLNFFTFSDNGGFKLFDVFQKNQETGTAPTTLANSDKHTNLVVKKEDGNCLSMFGIFGNGQNDTNDTKPVDPSQLDPIQVYRNQEDKISNQVPTPRYETEIKSIAQGSLASTLNAARELEKETTNLLNSGRKEILGRTPSVLIPSTNVEEENEFRLNVPEPEFVVNPPARETSLIGFEILKSIVYGGLMEVIASLSVVASAAASDATTLNIVALSLASLVGGILVIGHNLWDLKDDCKKESLIEGTNTQANNKYKELLGRVNYFPLHAFFAILSFLVFGMIPPVAYGYSFHKTNDKDYTVVAVAIASLLCVTLLATFKAYINKSTVLEYFKTVVYYITTAVSVSGVSYVAGTLATRLIEELGLFDTSSSGDVSFFPRATTPSFASF